MKIKTILWTLIGAGSLALAGWGGVTLYHVASAPSSNELPSTTVKRGDVIFAVHAKGDLQGGNSQTLSAPMISGDLVITSLDQSGALVQKGDTVVQFDTTDQTYKLREAEADLAEAEQK